MFHHIIAPNFYLSPDANNPEEFLATLVALHLTPVSEWVGEWAEFREPDTSVAWSFRACFLPPLPSSSPSITLLLFCPYLFLFPCFFALEKNYIGCAAIQLFPSPLSPITIHSH